MTEIDTTSVNIAFDEDTLNAMIYSSPWSPPEEVLGNSGRYTNEVSLGEEGTGGELMLIVIRF
jgi:hypothetical protein